MFEYFDITDEDPDGRPEFPPALVKRLHGLGFSDIGWVAAVVGRMEPQRPSAEDEEEPSDTRAPSPLISRVMLHDDGTTMLSLTRSEPDTDTLGLKTLFADGFVVSTETLPDGVGPWLARRRIQARPRDGYDFDGIDGSDPAALLDAHVRRVRASRSNAPERVPVAGSTLAQLATRARYWEIAGPRSKVRTRWTSVFATAVAFAMTAGVFATLVSLGAHGAFAVGAGVLALLVGMMCHDGAFRLSLYLRAPAPSLEKMSVAAMRPAASLLEAQAERSDMSKGRFSRIARAAARARQAHATVLDGAGRPLGPGAVAMLRRQNRRFIVGNAIALPALGFALMPVLGSIAPVAAVGVIAAVDGAFILVTKQTRADALRGWLLPDLARALGNTGRPRWWLGALLGCIALPALAVSRHSLTSDGAGLAPWVPVAWGCLGALLAYYVWKGTESGG